MVCKWGKIQMITKAAMIKKCRKILISNKISKDDHFFLLSIIKMHPNYIKKIGVGIEYFFIEKNIFGSRGFKIKRIDGSSTDFSFNKCLKRTTKNAIIRKACREAISTTIIKTRKKKGSHIHHEGLTFNDIVLSWLKQSGLDLRTNDSIDNCNITYFLNKKTRESFIDYHNKNAKLVELSVKEHIEVHKFK